MAYPKVLHSHQTIKRFLDLVRQNISSGYTVKQIVCAILLLNYVISNERTVKRILRRLNLRRRTESSVSRIIRGIQWLHRHVHNNYGYKRILCPFNKTLEIQAFQETVRHILSVMDPEGLTERQRRKLRRQLYVNSSPNYVVHIDGYPFQWSSR